MVDPPHGLQEGGFGSAFSLTWGKRPWRASGRRQSLVRRRWAGVEPGKAGLSTASRCGQRSRPRTDAGVPPTYEKPPRPGRGADRFTVDHEEALLHADAPRDHWSELVAALENEDRDGLTRKKVLWQRARWTGQTTGEFAAVPASLEPLFGLPALCSWACPRVFLPSNWIVATADAHAARAGSAPRRLRCGRSTDSFP